MSDAAVVRIGVIAPCSVVPAVELSQGIERLRQAGLDVRVHEQCAHQHFTFAGTDEQRATALLEYARSPEINVIWSGRGGYGATRLLPLLDAVTRQRGVPPRKLLVGYSDVTVLHEYVRTRWNWATLHADMPASPIFATTDPLHWDATIKLVRGQSPPTPWRAPLTFITDPPPHPIDAAIIGGTLTLWTCLTGTPYAPNPRGKILFFEDIGEPWYRIDRMVTQLCQAGAFEGARAIVLGDFKDCKDEVHMVRRDTATDEKVPLRPFYEPPQAIQEIFGNLGVPVATGVPAGHGPNFAPLPLGATYHLAPDGQLSLADWDWLNSPPLRAVSE